MRYILQLLTFLLCLLAAHPACSQSIDPYPAQLDTIFTNWNSNTPGGVVCVIRDGRVVYKKAFGLADLRKKIPNSNLLRYDLASNAKQFTAMCVALLEEQGKLSAEDDIRKYYPGLRISQTIRVKNLIDHTSGLRDAAVLAILSGKMNLKGEVRTRFNKKEYYLQCMMRETDLNYPVGTELAYNNFNYVLLGDIVEKVSGQSLAEFSDSAIFKPLGMRSTMWRDKAGMKIPDEATGYLFKKNKFRKRSPLGGIVGDHNLYATVDDVVKWQLNFIDNKLGNQSSSLMTRVTTGSKLNNGTPTRYGYGLWITDYKGIREVGHGGDDGRHTSILRHFPDERLSIIIVANSSRFGDTQEKSNAIADILLKGQIATAETAKEPFTFIQLSEKDLKAREGLFTGIDQRGLGKLANITFSDGSLYGSPNYYWKGLKLSAVSADHFVGITDMKETVHFHFSADPQKDSLTTRFRDQLHKYSRKKSEHVTFGDFAGRFSNHSTGATIKVKKRRGRIFARKGIIRIPLIPFGSDQFYAPANDALFIFERETNGTIAGFKVNAPDFRNFVFSKVD